MKIEQFFFVDISYFMELLMLLFVIDYSVSLPPANEVCEGYVFTPSVSHSVHRGVSASMHAGRHPPCAMHAGRYGQQVGGMHPTGMHTCSLSVCSTITAKY